MVFNETRIERKWNGLILAPFVVQVSSWVIIAKLHCGSELDAWTRVQNEISTAGGTILTRV